MTVTIKGNPVNIYAQLPTLGEKAPEFTLIKQDLSAFSLADLAGKKVVLNIFPSIDTPVCQSSVRAFNKAASQNENVTVACISADLPFAHGRFCGAEGIDNVLTGSTFRDNDFGKNYGIEFTSGPFVGLLARAVVIVNENGEVIYTELVSEVADEPNYDAALAAL